MVIHWYGEGCFKIETGGVTIITDPFEAATGLTPPRFKADIELRTFAPFPIPDVFGKARVATASIKGPGEYEIKGLAIKGWPLTSDAGSNHFKTYFLLEAEELKLVFLGHAAEEPEASFFENVGGADILFLPAGGAPFLPIEAASKLIKQMNPKIAVASFFKTPGLKRKAGDVKEFLRELDHPGEPQEKLVVRKSELPPSLKVIALKV